MNKLHIQGVSEFKYGMKSILYSSMMCSALKKFMHRTVPLKEAIRKHECFCGSSPENLFICDINKSFDKSAFLSLNR